jgi:hypothetical protein
MKKNDGGFSFGGSRIEIEDGTGIPRTIEYPGMTLRDYFAGQALASGACPFNSHEHERRAEWCRQEADAMLAEREKGAT